MSDKKMLQREDLFNLITCDPVTTRGKISLSNINLTKEITQDYFFNKLYVHAKVEKKVEPTTIDEELQYPYIQTKEEHDIYLYMYYRFKSMLLSDAPNSFPLLLLGSAGNGKSVEILHQLWEMKKDNNDKYNYFYCNFEKSYSELTHGIKFRLKPEQINEPLWLIAMSLLNSLYGLISQKENNTNEIFNNHIKYFLNNASCDGREKLLFEEIKKYNVSDPLTHQKVFEALVAFVVENVLETIEDLIKIIMNVLYCMYPKKKNILVFDNLEYYIKINQKDIPIHNYALREIYEAAQRVSCTIEDIYNRIEDNESWRAFKIIIALRRTSTRSIMRNSNEQFVSQMLKKGQDITNYFNIWEIWKEKRTLVWEKFLKEKYSNESNQIIDILNDMMDDTPGRLGTSYQERIAVLMNTSLRRNASAQAYAAYTLYEILCEDNSLHIDYIKYKLLVKKSHSAIRYFYRYMLLELQYRRMMYSPESRINFNKLKLIDASKSSTLVRRVLGFLSHFKDNHTCTDEKGKTLKANIYETISLYRLMKHIFITPNEIHDEEISKKYDSKSIDNNINIIGQGNTFSELASVLISLANMNNYVNKTAPFIILGINDKNFNEDSSEEELTTILKKIWDAGEAASKNNGKYDRLNYGVRLTDAGAMFLFDIQPSFPFIASLKEKNSVPLFLLKNKNEIKKTIKDVYNLSNLLCETYENTATAFCGKSNSLTVNNYYLPPNNSGSFRERVRCLHTKHLILYSDFIRKSYDTLGISYRDLLEITRFVEHYKVLYEKWNTTKECF